MPNAIWSVAGSLSLGAVGSLVVGCAGSEEPLPSEAVSTTLPDDDDDETASATTQPPSPSTTSMPTETDGTASTGGDPTGDPESETGREASSATDDPTTDSDTTVPPADPCEGRTHSLIGEGFVTASSEYDTLFGPIYAAELGVDGDIATSWFSEGPNVDGTESTYEWYTQSDRCIDRIVLRSNDAHANPDFHVGFGFGHVRIDVINTSGVTVYSEDIDLDGSPDPDVDLDPGGVQGNQVLLSLSGHESEDCGGFSELAINGREER